MHSEAFVRRNVDLGLVDDQPAAAFCKRLMPPEQSLPRYGFSRGVVRITHYQHIGLFNLRIKLLWSCRGHSVSLPLPGMGIFVVGQCSQGYPREWTQARKRLYGCLSTRHRKELICLIVVRGYSLQRRGLPGQALPLPRRNRWHRIARRINPGGRGLRLRCSLRPPAPSFRPE